MENKKQGVIAISLPEDDEWIIRLKVVYQVILDNLKWFKNRQALLATY